MATKTGEVVVVEEGVVSSSRVWREEKKCTRGWRLGARWVWSALRAQPGVCANNLRDERKLRRSRSFCDGPARVGHRQICFPHFFFPITEQKPRMRLKNQPNLRASLWTRPGEQRRLP